MKASDVIKRLQELIADHGDLPVRYQSESTEVSVLMIMAYNDIGNESHSDDDKETHFFVH